MTEIQQLLAYARARATERQLARNVAYEEAAALLETRADELTRPEAINATTRYAAYCLRHAAESIRGLKEEQS